MILLGYTGRKRGWREEETGGENGLNEWRRGVRAGEKRGNKQEKIIKGTRLN